MLTKSSMEEDPRCSFYRVFLRASLCLQAGKYDINSGTMRVYTQKSASSNPSVEKLFLH